MENLQTKLFEAAKQGSVNSLQQLLKDDPLILDIAAVSCFNESSLLHFAAMLGHVDFVKEIIRVKPELVDELNSQKSTPLHLASAKGHVEVVRALLSVDQRACLARDRNELTPIHLAADKGRVEVVKVLLEAQPDAAYRGKSILHLCVERCQLEALEVVVRALGDEEAFINSVDADGNTVLHLAVAAKQVEGYTKAQPNQVCKLIKSLYGLKQASREWNAEFCKHLLAYGFVQSNHDHCLFVKGTGSSFLALLVYVDDILIIGPDIAAITHLKASLHSAFTIKDLGDARYFLGIEMARGSNGTYLNQRKYILDMVDSAGLLGCSSVATPFPAGLTLSSTQGDPFSHPDQYRRLLPWFRIGMLRFMCSSISKGVLRMGIAYFLVQHSFLGNARSNPSFLCQLLRPNIVALVPLFFMKEPSTLIWIAILLVISFVLDLLFPSPVHHIH